MVKPDKRDTEIARHFMRALAVALTDKGLTQGQAEVKAGLPSGTISLWMRGERTPSALRFAEVAASLGIDPGALVNDGLRRATQAGLLSDIEVIERD